MAKKKSKLLRNIGIIFAVIIATIIFISILIPGFGASIIPLLTFQQTNCKITPFNPNCACSEGNVKISLDEATEKFGSRDTGIFFCEPVSSVVNLDASDFAEQIQRYCLQRFDVELPECKISQRLNECDRLENSWFDPQVTGENAGRRIGLFECAKEIAPNTFQGLAQCEFFVDNGEIHRIANNDRFWCFDEEMQRHPPRI